MDSQALSENVREQNSTKDLWFKLESEYQGRNQDTKIEVEVKSIEDEKQEEKEEHASDTNEGRNLFDYSSSDCDNVEDDLEEAKKDVLVHLLADIDLRYNLRLKRKILGSFEKYHEKSVDLLKKLSLKKTSLQVELEDKDNEIKRLKINPTSQENLKKQEGTILI